MEVTQRSVEPYEARRAPAQNQKTWFADDQRPAETPARAAKDTTERQRQARTKRRRVVPYWAAGMGAGLGSMLIAATWFSLRLEHPAPGLEPTQARPSSALSTPDADPMQGAVISRAEAATEALATPIPTVELLRPAPALTPQPSTSTVLVEPPTPALMPETTASTALVEPPPPKSLRVVPPRPRPALALLRDAALPTTYDEQAQAKHWQNITLDEF